jgi:hypothetical protein
VAAGFFLIPGLGYWLLLPIDPIIYFYRIPRNNPLPPVRSLYMKLLRVTLCFAALALVAGAAPVYKVTLTEPAVVAGSVVKPGDYRIVVNGDKATLTMGKTSLEVPVKVESGKQKFHYTSVECRMDGGQNMLDDIQVGISGYWLLLSRTIK